MVNKLGEYGNPTSLRNDFCWTVSNNMAFSRLYRKFKILRYLCVALVFISFIKMYPSIKRRLTPLAPEPVAENRTFLLTVNHDLGRLGNKLFKYAALLGLAEREGRRPFVLPYTEDVDMENVFNLTFVEHRSKYDTDSWTKITETDYARDDPVFRNLPKRDLMLIGCLQSWKYFHKVEHIVRQQFQLKDRYKFYAEGVLNDIRQRQRSPEQIVFVGVHVRRRDKLSTKYTCVSPKSFFVNSFQKMRSLLPGKTPIFIVSGNDLNWCEEHLASNDTIVLQPAAPAFHFAILASCDHFIVTVGTFGWWAGWLTGGHVIYYKKFPLPYSFEAMGFHFDDYYPISWIGVDD